MWVNFRCKFLADVGQFYARINNTLTTGVDSATLTSNGVVNGVIGSGNATVGLQATSTLTALDKIAATGTGNTLNISDLGSVAGGSSLPAGLSVSGVQTVNLISSTGTNTDNFSGFTGLTQLNVTEIGGAAGITAAGTTNVTLTDTAAAATASNITVNGGANVAVTANGVNTAGTINVGQTTAATGTVTVTETVAATGAGAFTADAINVKGGTTVTVTANLTETAATPGTVTGGTVAVTGTAATTSVTVNQTASVKAAPAVTATAASAAVTAVSAAPGVNAVAGAAAAASAAAKAVVGGVADGVVQITDASFGTANANTITSVSLSNYGGTTAASSYVADNALTNLSLSGTAGTLSIIDATSGTAAAPGAVATANPTLNLTVNGLKVGVDATGAALGNGNTVTDTNNEITTLNVTTATADSLLSGFVDSKLATLNIGGTNTLTFGAGGLNATNDAALKTITVSGSAGFNDGNTGVATGLASFATPVALTTTSSGTITASLNDTVTSFTGSTGRDVITINGAAAATKAITAGSATNNELILDGAYGLTATTAASTAALVTGFQTLGVTAGFSGTVDVSVLDKAASLIDVLGSNTAAVGAIAFTKVATGAAIALDANITTGSVSVGFIDTNGAADATTVTIGAATNAAAIAVNSLTLTDATSTNGIGTVTFVSNDTGYNSTGSGTANLGNSIATFSDVGLSTLNVSGTGALTISSFAGDTATAFTLNNTDTGVGGVTLSTFNDAALKTLTFTGTGASTVSHLVDAQAAVTIANTGTGTATVGDIGAAAAGDANATLTSLTLTGNVALGSNTTNVSATTGIATATATAIGATTGVTVSGATDNAHVNINLTGAAAGLVADTITLGNGNNYVTDGSTAGSRLQLLPGNARQV